MTVISSDGCLQRLPCCVPTMTSSRWLNFERKHCNYRSLSHTGVVPTSSKQSLTPHQLYPAMSGIYRRLAHSSGTVIRLHSHSIHRTSANSPLLLEMFEKGSALTAIDTPLELDPFSETNYDTFPSKGENRQTSLGLPYTTNASI